ncbi:MAG: alpha/beta hydrolase [Anaerolineaceae bacterium]|nr:alpha/beta hydrolase [Anaerolineaceae bacterium]
MKGLFLYGANCTMDVWTRFKPFFDIPETRYVAYPHAVTKQAKTVSDITAWVYETYQNELPLDFIVGHSMGGIIALQLVTQHAFRCHQVILIETNLKPANLFYRNLMTEKNMAIFGDQILAMIQSEAPFYSDALKQSLREDFDYADLVREFTGQVYGIYGDRGVADYKSRIADLCLDADIEQRIRFHFVRDACHMPMVENPEDLAAIIRQITKLPE